MNTDLLDAECAIDFLYTLKIIKSIDWKSHHYLINDSAEYTVYFESPGHNGDVGLQVIKRAESYFITRSIIKILAKRHNFDANSILTKCAV